MVTIRTLWEIKQEKDIDNLTIESEHKYLTSFDDDDEFYTDGVHYQPENEVKALFDIGDGLKYINSERSLQVGFYVEWRTGTNFKNETDCSEELLNICKDNFNSEFVQAKRIREHGWIEHFTKLSQEIEDYCLDDEMCYLEWLWGADND